MAEWNFNTTDNTFGDTLEHHGILGMKWGIRRFQPYKKGEKKGKEVDEAAKKRKKVIKGVAITAGTVAGVAAAVYALKNIKLTKFYKQTYADLNKAYNFKSNRKSTVNTYQKPSKTPEETSEFLRDLGKYREKINDFVDHNPKAKKVISKEDLDFYKKHVREVKNLRDLENKYGTFGTIFH